MNNNFRNFICGMGSILDIFPAPVDIDNRSDVEKLRADFEKIGKELTIVMEQVASGEREK